MIDFLKFKIVILLLSVWNVSSGNKFSHFKTCVEERGIESGRIVWRSESNKYRSLNFQWQLKPPEIRPLAYIVMVNEDDVVTSVVCGVKHKVRVVARSGGHSFEKYSFGDNSSVVLDLGNMNSIFLDKSSSLTAIGPGALVGTIAMSLWNSGQLFFPISSCPTVGISGLATGGGYGYLSRSYGLATDHIRAMRVVTAQGERLIVNKLANPDLFWALVGGGVASFGIVTEFLMKVLPAPPVVFTVTVIWKLDDFVGVYKAWQTFTLIGPRSITAKMNINSEQISIFFVDSTGTSSAFDKVEKAFPPPANSTRETLSYPDYLVEVAGPFAGANGTTPTPNDLLSLKRTSTSPDYQVERSFYVGKIILEKAMEDLQEFLSRLPGSVVASFQAYGGAINDVRNEETAFVHRNGIFALGIISNGVATPADLSANSVVDEYFELGKSIFNHTESYQNYVDGELGDYLQRYYGTNLGRLIEVKQKYDPTNYFRNPQSIPVKYESFQH